jgi:Dolichyl-phosphate-mannose-protein mannosyltransferase
VALPGRAALPRRVVAVAGLATVALAAVPVLLYLWIALHRLDYPYELDWMEGGSVGNVGRLLAGHSLYAAPSLKFVGWTYPPLYWLASAAVAQITGLGFLPLRIVSFVSSLVAIAMLGKLVRDETGDRTAGVVAAGLFAATYRLSGSWFDVGRVDSMFLALSLVTLVYGRHAQGVRGGLVLGLLAFLAFFTKQTALIALAPALVWLVLTRRPVGVSAILMLAALVVISTVVLDAATGGWYRYYVFSELSGQGWAAPEWLDFWRTDLFSHLWPLCVLLVVAVLVAVGLALRSRRAEGGWSAGRGAVVPPFGFQLAATVGLLAAAWFSRLHTGGYLNVLMPAYAGCALIGGLAYGQLRRHGRLATLLATAAIVVQLVVLAYPVAAQIPTRADRTAGTELLAALRKLPAPVLILRHPWYGTLAGKGSFAQGEGISDALRSQAVRGARILRASLPDALNRYHVQTVVLDGDSAPSWLVPQLQREFRLESSAITATKLYPLTDLRTAPSLVYVRRSRT